MYKLLMIFTASIATGILLYFLFGHWQSGVLASSAVLAFCGFIQKEFEEIHDAITNRKT
jgi:hypothetical protein